MLEMHLSRFGTDHKIFKVVAEFYGVTCLLESVCIDIDAMCQPVLVIQ